MLQYHSVSLCGFPSLWLQLLQCSVESQLVVPDLDEEHLPLKSYHLRTSYSIRRLAAVTNMHHRMNLHSSMNFSRFHTFTTQKPNNTTLFFPGASLKWGSHLYTDTVTVFVHLHYAATYRPFCTLFVARLPT